MPRYETTGGDPRDIVLLDLLMATMDSISTWTTAAGDAVMGVAWRDAVTARMIDVGRYLPYDELTAAAASGLGLAVDAASRLRDAWTQMRPWPDAVAVHTLRVPYGFVTNCSADLATLAVERSGLRPAFTLSAEEAGWYKPRPQIYRLACERAGVSADRVSYVAGAPYDAQGAASVGFATTIVRRRPISGSLPQEIRVVDSLHDAFET